MLYDNGRVGNQWPEIVRTYTWIPLEMVEKGLCIGVIIRIYYPQMSVKHKNTYKVEKCIHDCFTQSNFFQAPFLRLLRRLVSLTFWLPASTFDTADRGRNAVTAAAEFFWLPLSVRSGSSWFAFAARAFRSDGAKYASSGARRLGSGCRAGWCSLSCSPGELLDSPARLLEWVPTGIEGGYGGGEPSREGIEQTRSSCSKHGWMWF